MLDADTVENLPELQGVKRLISAGGWRKRWNHWDGRGFLKDILPHDNFYMTFFRAEEGRLYAFKLFELFYVLDETFQEKQAHRDFCCLSWSYDELWFVHRHQYRWQYIYFQRLQRLMVSNQSFPARITVRFLRFSSPSASSITLAFRNVVKRSKCRSYWLLCLPGLSLITVTVSCAVLSVKRRPSGVVHESNGSLWPSCPSWLVESMASVIVIMVTLFCPIQE